jgi:hypothetical protein
LNSEAFQGLNKLYEVDLKGNICIDEKFYDKENNMRDLKQTVNEKCHFDETKTTASTLSNNDQNLVLKTSSAQSNTSNARPKAESPDVELH